jgi:hypothetical protein
MDSHRGPLRAASFFRAHCMTRKRKTVIVLLAVALLLVSVRMAMP